MYTRDQMLRMPLGTLIAEMAAEFAKPTPDAFVNIAYEFVAIQNIMAQTRESLIYNNFDIKLVETIRPHYNLCHS